MPAFAPRTRVQILRQMISRVLGRSDLSEIQENSATMQILAGAASEDAEQYYQLARLQDLFSIDDAEGSDLDARARDYVPKRLPRLGPVAGTTQLVFSRPGTSGTVSIPIGTTAAAEDAEGLVKFRTTSSGSITPGNSVSGLIDAVAIDKGSRGNVGDGEIIKFVSRIVGVTGVTNPSEVTNGRDRERDEEYRTRIKEYIQGLSRGTPTALRSAAKNVILIDGRRALFANVFEPAIPDGTTTVYIDDGTGSVDEWEDTYVGTDDTLLASALGGEIEVYSTLRPIRDFISLSVNGTPLVNGVDFVVNKAMGKFVFDPVLYPSGLTTGDAVTARYRAYTGLIKAVQKVIDGDPSDPTNFPGVREGGQYVLVLSAQGVFQTVVASISVLAGYNPVTVAAKAKTAVQDYINSLDIGENVIVAEIIERAMAIRGMYNFSFTELSGASPTDQVILYNQVARITSADITLI